MSCSLYLFIYIKLFISDVLSRDKQRLSIAYINLYFKSLCIVFCSLHLTVVTGLCISNKNRWSLFGCFPSSYSSRRRRSTRKSSRIFPGRNYHADTDRCDRLHRQSALLSRIPMILTPVFYRDPLLPPPPLSPPPLPAPSSPASPPSFIHHHLLRLPPLLQAARGTRHVTDSPSLQVDELWACLPAARCPAPITARTLAAGAPT